ncbi:unnamed protein product, partial [Alopecurus aequalis]
MAGRRKKKASASAGGKDRFEDLPDHVLEQLLSFLPSQEAVQTCVLAKRWRHIWKSVSSLRIHTDKFETEEQSNTFVNKVVELRDPTAPLHVCEMVPYDDIESWLQYAVACKMQVLRVEGNPYYISQSQLSNNSVISEHLTRLVLYHVEIDSLDLSRCEALEVFEINDCIINLEDICGKSLRHLIIRDSSICTTCVRTRISAPGLVTCELADCRDFTPLFGSLPSLVTAFIRIILESEEDCDGLCKGFCCKDDYSVLLEGLSGATNLELFCESWAMIFSKDLRWRPMFGRLKTVSLNDWCVTDNFTGLIYFLQHSPILERLTLQLSSSLKSSRKILKSKIPREQFLVSKHLKVVEIKSYNVKNIQICQIANLLGTLGVTWEKINIDEDFCY